MPRRISNRQPCRPTSGRAARPLSARPRLSLALTAALILAGGAGAWALAGPITPPAGPVAPTLKTLSEVEPAIALATLPGDATAQVVISQPGSYYLTADLAATEARHAIRVLADHVTIDLRGFSLRDANPPGSFRFGIETPQARSNFVFRNGTVRGFAYMTVGAFTDSVFADLQILDCPLGGLEVTQARNTLVRNVVVARCGEVAIRTTAGSIIQSCTVDGAFVGISTSESVVRDCVVRNSTGIGIDASASIIEACTVSAIHSGSPTLGQGIRGQHLAQIHNNRVSDCSGPGIEVGQNSSILENHVSFCREGILILDFGGRGGNRVEANHLTVNQVGVKISLAGNIVVRNSIQESAVAPTQIVAGNSVGTLRTDAATAGPCDNLITP